MANIASAQSGLASATSTWVGGVAPTASDRVLIAAGHTVELDGVFEWGGDSTATITIAGVSTTRAINIAGTLKHSRTVSSQLTCVGNICVLAGGWHDMGTEADPILLPVTSQLILNKSALMSTNKYGYETLTTARVTAWGSPKLRTAHLTAAASVGATSIQVDEATGWQPGDELAISQTDMGGVSRQGYGTIASGYTPGDLTIPLVAALAFNHAAGALVGNGTNNLTVKSYNNGTPSSAFHLYASLTAAPGSRELGHITFDTLGGTYPAYGLSVRFESNFSSTPGPQVYRAMKGITVYKRNFLGNVAAAQLSEKASSSDPIPYEDLLVVGAALTDENVMTVITGDHCKQVRTVYLNITYQLGGVTDVSLDDCTLLARRRESLTAFGALSQKFTRLKLGGFRLGSCGVICHANAVGVANDVVFTDCDFGVTYPLPAGSALFYFQTLDSRLTAVVQDCMFSDNVTDPVLSAMGNLTNESSVKIVNRNKDPLQQIEYLRQGVFRRDNATRFRGTSSISMRPNFVGLKCTRAQNVPCGNGKTVRVVGYVKLDSAYLNGGDCNAPTVTLGGLGASPAQLTMQLNTDWQKFDLSATNASGADGSFVLALSAIPKTVATGMVYLDGVADAPFITKVRHYGFLFDEASSVRTINPVVQVSEAVAAAYTGVAVDALAPKIAVGAGTVDTWRKLYDWYQAWACANVDKDALLTSGDGINFSLPLTCKLEWGGMPAAGTLSGGWLQLAAPGVHSYSLSGSKIDFMAAGTYNMSGTQFSGTVELVNSSGGAVVVQAPVGVSYTNTGPNITVELPSLDVVVSAPALISGSRVQLYNLTDDVEVLNAELVSAGMTYTTPFTSNKIMRLRADHASKLPLETVGVLTASGLTFLDVQAEDDVYLGNGIDGGAVSEFAPDGANIQVDINDPDGVTNIQRLYAWLQWYMTTEEGVRSTFFGAVSAIDSANYVINQTKADIKLDNVAAFPVRVVGGYLSRRDGSTVIAPLSHSIQMDPGKAYAIETGVSGLTADEGNKLNQISLLALETTAQSAASAAAAAAVQATEAADNTTTLLGQSAPTAAAVAAAVWADAKAGTLALEVTTQEALAAAELAASRGADLLAQPAPTVEAITDGVWTAVDALALEATADAAMQAAELAASRTAELLTRPALTADAVAEGVWAATADTHDAAGSMGAVVNSVSDLALESTAQAAANNAALAAALSA